MCGSYRDFENEDDLPGHNYVDGWMVNKLPGPSSAKRRHVRPKIDALRQTIKGGNETPHMFSTGAWKLSRHAK